MWKIRLLFVIIISLLTYFPRPSYGQEGWEEVSPMLTARSEMPATVLGGKIYVPGGFGGLDTFEVYDAAADTWTTLTAMPAGRDHLMATTYKNKLYIFGGFVRWQPQSTAFVYDPTTDEWTALADMPENRAAGVAVTLDDFIYIVGGVSDDESVIPPLLRYDSAQDEWTALAPTSVVRDHLAAVVLDNQIWAIGGRSTGVEYDSVEIYDPETDTWATGPSLNIARAGFNATLIDDKVYVAGGEVFAVCPNSDCPQTLDTVEAYDPETETWEIVTQMPVPLHGVPIASVDDALYVLGGSKEAGAILNDGRVFVYHP